jgi:hypothetical protein
MSKHGIELEQTLRDEVFPICRWNLLSIAGEWAGFVINGSKRRSSDASAGVGVGGLASGTISSRTLPNGNVLAKP